jgi:hypothetical protein
MVHFSTVAAVVGSLVRRLNHVFSTDYWLYFAIVMLLGQIDPDLPGSARPAAREAICMGPGP